MHRVLPYISGALIRLSVAPSRKFLAAQIAAASTSARAPFLQTSPSADSSLDDDDDSGFVASPLAEKKDNLAEFNEEMRLYFGGGEHMDTTDTRGTLDRARRATQALVEQQMALRSGDRPREFEVKGVANSAPRIVDAVVDDGDLHIHIHYHGATRSVAGGTPIHVHLHHHET